MKKRLLAVLTTLLMVLIMAAGVQAADKPYVIDDADLLTTEQVQELDTKAQSISTEYACDIVILTNDYLDNKSATEYADDYYDEMGYGQGSGRDGVLFMISMDDRSWAISTSGYGATAFTDYGQQALMENIMDNLSYGEYYEAFDTFLDISEDYLRQADNGKPYDNYGAHVSSQQGQSDSLVKRVIISLVAGFLIALIIVGGWKKQVRANVRPKSGAADYVKQGSFRLTRNSDMFLYRTVNRTPKPQSNSGGGGSSMHISSSGSSHGGSSGHF